MEVPLILDSFIHSIEQLASSCSGDVQSLIKAAREAYTQGSLTDMALAQVFEQAGSHRATANDRTGAWWAACACASLRSSSKTSAQQDAEILAARWLGEFAHSPAKEPLPEFCRWLVASNAEPVLTLRTLELARRNASTYLERLEAELMARQPLLQLKLDAHSNQARAEVESAIDSYKQASVDTRVGLSRVVDFLWARSGDAQLGERGLHILEEFDTFVSEHLLQGISSIEKSLQLASKEQSSTEPSQQTTTQSSQLDLAQVREVEPQPALASTSPTIEQLEHTMRAAFERAWHEPTLQNREEFERAIRARYEPEVASIEDLETRQKALEHYVHHALAQLPSATQ